MQTFMQIVKMKVHNLYGFQDFLIPDLPILNTVAEKRGRKGERIT